MDVCSTFVYFVVHSNSFSPDKLINFLQEEMPNVPLFSAAIKSRRNERIKKLSGETLEAGKARIDGFTALSSSVYICLTSPDPILTAFFLSHKADKLAFDDPNFRVCINHNC